MSYTPTNWKDGDVITSQRLNKIENGISESTQDLFFIIKVIEPQNSESLPYLDKTFSEIESALENGKILLVYSKTQNTEQQGRVTFSCIYNSLRSNIVIQKAEDEEIPEYVLPYQVRLDGGNYFEAKTPDETLVYYYEG